MLPSAPVDYARIRGDYEFFLAHSTETAAQIEALGPHMAWLGRRPKPTSMLDFGCGSGLFTERLLHAAGLPPDALALHLVEPVPDHLQEATRRLAPFACRIVAAEVRSDEAAGDGFDLILANHSLYYVADPTATAAALLGRLAPGGRLIAALLDHDNALARIWKAGFADAKLPFPFALAEDIEAVFRQQGWRHERERIDYRVAFPDSAEARRQILRFLLGANLEALSNGRIKALFAPYRQGDLVMFETAYPHLVARRETRWMVGPMTEHTDTEHTDQAAMHDGESEATAVRDFRAHVVAIGAFGGDGVIRDHRFAPIDQGLCANPSALLKLRLGD